MFHNLPIVMITDHKFVRSGMLALWAEYQTRLSYTRKGGSYNVSVNKDPKHISTISCFEQALVKEIFGTFHVIPNIPQNYLKVIKNIVEVATSVGVESGRLTEHYFEDDPGLGNQDRLKYSLSSTFEKVNFCSDFLSLVRKLFVAEGVSSLRSPDKYRVREVLKFLATRENSSIDFYERSIRKKMGVKSKLHSILNSLFPFVYDTNQRKSYKKYQLNELGLELWKAIEKEFYHRITDLKNNAVPIAIPLTENPIDANQMLLLLSFNRISKFDLNDYELFASVLGLLTDCQVTSSHPRVFSALEDVVRREFILDYNFLVSKGHIQRRSRHDGQISNHATAYWLELTSLGTESLKNSSFMTDNFISLKNKLIEVATRTIKSLISKDRTSIMKYALEMHAQGKSWNEKELRKSLLVEKSMSSFIFSLYPLIVLDETYYGKGNRYKISDFGIQVANNLM